MVARRFDWGWWSVSFTFSICTGQISDVEAGYSRKLSGHARGFGENRWW